MQQQKLLEVINLEVSFRTEEGSVKALKGISFTLHRGEAIGIVGESGSGKSVTSLAIMRLLSGNASVLNGQILYYDEDGKVTDLLTLPIGQMQRYRGNEIAMIFQEPMSSLNPVMKCGPQVAEAIMLHQGVSKVIAKQKTIALFEKVKLPDPERAFNAYPHQLSGGQKQRVMIAMAISCNPALLIADEPTTALDVTVQQNILQLIAELQAEYGMAVMFISHDLGVIAEIAQRVLVMFRGEVMETGLVLDVFKNAKHPYTKSLLACRPPLDYRLSRLPVVSDFMENVADGAGGFRIIEKNKDLTALRLADTYNSSRIAQLSHEETLIKVENLSVWYPKTTNFWGKVTDHVKAVDDVSFTIKRGETLGLVGESGCGKTTLGRALLRLSPATAGHIWYKNQDIANISEADMKPLRREMQIIFQDPFSSLNPRLTVGEAILEPIWVHRLFPTIGQCKQRALELLDMVGLEAKHFDRYPHEFSGGQRQRVCIARALALNPQFVICDESVAALDVSVQAQVLNLLMELRERMQFTCIFISHDLSVVKLMSDHIIVMNKGKIEEMGMADDIYHHPSKAYTQQLIAAIPKGVR